MMVLAAHYRLLGNSSDWQISKIVRVLHVMWALLLCLVCCSYSYSYKETVPALQDNWGSTSSKA